VIKKIENFCQNLVTFAKKKNQKIKKTYQMKSIIKLDNRLLASLAVFRELYNSEKDVYGIIAVFLTDLIKTNNLYSFSLSNITDLLNSTFEFDIPPAVVKTSLGRLDFVNKTKTEYAITEIAKIKGQIIDEKQKQILSNNKTIIDKLFGFIENEIKQSLSNSKKERISHSFCCFLLDLHDSDEYIAYITAFILKNEGDINFKNQLNIIREGVILYSGIKYNNDLNDLGTWKSELTIYIDTEILFRLAGYDGELYKSLTIDFLTYVREINDKAKKQIIKLKYFEDEKDEIERFFAKARCLLEGRERLDPSVTAMVSIVNGCKTQSDILGKKSDFYTQLKSYKIEEDTYKNYFDEKNHQYNIVNQEIIDKVSQELGKDSFEYLKFLNYIAIRRKNAYSNNFENIGHILLTGNSITLKVAWNELVKENGFVPLATGLSFLTNKFWFKLNKGFGKGSLPKSFDVVTQSQIILSKVLNESVGEKFKELQREYKIGKLTEEQAKARIIDLRDQVRKPEEIKNDIVIDVLSTITEDSLEKFVEEQSHIKSKVEQQQQEHIKLQEELDSKKDVEIQLLKAKEDLLEEKQNSKEYLERQKKSIDKISKEKYRNFKLRIIVMILLYYILLIIAIFYYTWDIMEQYTFILGLMPVIVSSIYLLIKERTLKPLNYLRKKQKKIHEQTYKDFDINKFKETKNAIDSLKKEINKIKNGG
jgi:hypothetical protein